MSAIMRMGIVGLLALTHPVSAEENQPAPEITDLDFLIGEWDIENRLYYHAQPERLLFVEKGRMQCSYDLPLNGKNKYILCRANWEVTEGSQQVGRTRQTLEAISYNRFARSFEEIGVYSNWPSHGANRLRHDPDKHVVVLEGTLMLKDHVVERLQTTIFYNEDYTEYSSRNVANFSNMPVTQFNRVFEGRGRKLR